MADGCDARDGVAGPYDLHESAGSPGCLRDGIQGQGDLRYAYGLPGGKEPFGGLADAHDLGAAVNAGRDRAGHVYAFFVSEDAAGDIRALMVGGMGQQRKAVHVTDGIDAFGGFKMVVHVDEAAAFQRAARLFAIKPGCIRSTAHGDQRLGGGQHAPITKGQLGLPVLRDERLRHDARDAGPARLALDAVHFFGDVGVFSRGDVRGGLDDGDFGAHHAEEVAKLKADGPSAHDDEAFRDFGKVEDAGAVEHGVAVGSEAGEGRARRAAGKDDVVIR